MVMSQPPTQDTRPWWDTRDPAQVAGQDGLDPLDLRPQVPISGNPAPVAPAAPQPSFKPIEPDYRWDMPVVLAKLRAEIPAVPRSSGFFQRMAGSVFDVTGDLVGTAMDLASWPAETTERVAGMFYWNDIPLGDRWAMGKLTWEQFGFGKGPQREEILRRFRSGEQIDTIAKDYEGGMSDLVGQLLADPLNILGVPGLGLLAKVSDAAKVPRLSKALRVLNEGLVLPRFSYQDFKAADILENVSGSRPASKWLARGVRPFGLNQTADERNLQLVKEMVRDTTNYGIDPADARRVVDNWRLRGADAGWRSVQQTAMSRASEAKAAGQELMTGLVRDTRLTHADLLGMQDEIISGKWDGELTRSHPEWLVPGTTADRPLPHLWEEATGGVHPNPPQGLFVMDAAAAEARGQKLTADKIFAETQKHPWFEGTPEEYALLSPAEKKRWPFANREQWGAQFLLEWTKFSEGDMKVGGAIDHYLGNAADVVKDAEGNLITIPRELTEIEKLDRKAQAFQGHAKRVMTMGFLNKPAYLVGNLITNTAQAIQRIGMGLYRNNDADIERFGGELMRDAINDRSRAGYQGFKQATGGKVTVGSALKSAVPSWTPFANLANVLPHVGDQDVRLRIGVETAANVFNHVFLPSDISAHGILKPIQWAEGTTPDEQRAFVSAVMNIRNEGELDAKIADLSNGTLSIDHAGFLLQRVLESDGLDQTQAAYLRNLVGEKGHRELGAALAAAGDPTEAKQAIDRVAGELHDFSYSFMKDVPLPIYRSPNVNLREMRAQNSVAIRRWFEGLFSAVQRKAEIHGIHDPGFEGELDELTSTLEGGQQRMFRRLDDELSPYNAANDMTTPAGRKAMRDARAAVAKEYDDLETEAWKRVDQEFSRLITHPEMKTWWADFQKRRNAARAAVKGKLGEVFKALGDDWSYLDEQGDAWRGYMAYKDEVYQRLLGDTYTGLGLKQLPSHMEPVMEEGIDLAHGMMRYSNEQGAYLRKLADHADELFQPLRRDEAGNIIEWGPRQFQIDPERAAGLRQYLEDLRPDLRVTETVARRAGRAMADDALLSYDTRYGFDKILTYVMPYQFWGTRMPSRWVHAAQARPGTAAAFAILLKSQREMQDDLPERLRGRLRIPVPFLPDWMGNDFYFDPIRYFFPPATSLGKEAEGDNVWGQIYNWFGQVGAVPSPAVSLPLQMTGVLGERDSYIRSFMSGGPSFMPGTDAQKGVWALTHGAPPGDWQDTVDPEAWDAIMLGQALPEPQIRKILGLQPGDQWDAYRVLRSLASGAADGSWTAEQAVHAMQSRSGAIWERGKDRAGKEAGIREVSTWLGLPASIYPKGERLQNGLQAMYAVARDMDRAAGTDGMVDAFYQSYPEFQARDIQKALLRGIPEAETAADTTAFFMDLGAIKKQYDSQIEYLQQVMDSMPPIAKQKWKDQIGVLYDERAKQIDALDLKYPRRRTAPSLSAAPHDRALGYLREQFYKIKGDSYQAEKAARDIFLSRLTGRGQATNYYRLALQRDELFAQFDQRLAGASNTERESIYDERKRALEALTEQAIPDISRQDFEDFLARSQNEQEDAAVARQRLSDRLATLFSSSDARRVLREHPELSLEYGTTPDPQTAGQIDSWWNWFYALPPNSRARDDYVQSYLPRLNDWRQRVGLPPLEPRVRPEAGPIVINGDPYQQAIAAAEAEMR